MTPDLRNSGYVPDVHRLLPQDPDAEKGVLCSILLSPRSSLDACSERGVSADWFHIPAHATIYSRLVGMDLEQQAIDFITLSGQLADRSELEQCGGRPFITDLFTFVPTAANVAYYLDRMAKKTTLRRVVTVGTEYASRAYDDHGEESDALLDQFEKAALAVRIEQNATQDAPTLKDDVMEAIERIEKLYERRGGITGLPTGFRQLDFLTDGLHAAQMIVIAARPSMGKTAIGMNIAEHVACFEKRAVGIFSLEMSRPQLVMRLLASMARVNLQKVRNGFLAERDFPSITAASAKLAVARMLIDDRGGLEVSQLKAKARRWKKAHDIALVVVDYLQLLKGSKSRRNSDNRQLEVSEVSGELKSLAKELNIPVLVLAQLNRQPDARSGGKPRLSDLRESGAIEQDSDVIGFLVRPEVYAQDEEAKSDCEGEANLYIEKQRDGPVGNVPLTFLKEFTRFTDRAETRDEREPRKPYSE